MIDLWLSTTRSAYHENYSLYYSKASVIGTSLNRQISRFIEIFWCMLLNLHNIGFRSFQGNLLMKWFIGQVIVNVAQKLVFLYLIDFFVVIIWIFHFRQDSGYSSTLSDYAIDDLSKIFPDHSAHHSEMTTSIFTDFDQLPRWAFQYFTYIAVCCVGNKEP